jgi:hypothetical protein
MSYCKMDEILFENDFWHFKNTFVFVCWWFYLVKGKFQLYVSLSNSFFAHKRCSFQVYDIFFQDFFDLGQNEILSPSTRSRYKKLQVMAVFLKDENTISYNQTFHRAKYTPTPTKYLLKFNCAICTHGLMVERWVTLKIPCTEGQQRCSFMQRTWFIKDVNSEVLDKSTHICFEDCTDWRRPICWLEKWICNCSISNYVFRSDLPLAYGPLASQWIDVYRSKNEVEAVYSLSSGFF